MSALLLESPPADLMPLEIDLPNSLRIGEMKFAEFCRKNETLRIEQDRHGNVLVMAPVGFDGGGKELRLGAQLQLWSDCDGTGIAFSSSTLFTLPNGAKRSPDASWVSLEKAGRLTPRDRKGFARICPDFVVELRSSSDRLPPLRQKMAEYLENGVRLGLLIDPVTGKAHVYRPGREVETHRRPASLSAEPEMPGLVFDLRRIW